MDLINGTDGAGGSVLAEEGLAWARQLRLMGNTARLNAKLAEEMITELSDVHALLRETLDSISAGGGGYVGPAALHMLRLRQAAHVQRAGAMLERYSRLLTEDVARGADGAPASASNG